MKLEEALPFARQGLRIRLKPHIKWIHDPSDICAFTLQELMGDWEVQEQEKPMMKAYWAPNKSHHLERGEFFLIRSTKDPESDWTPAPEFNQK